LRVYSGYLVVDKRIILKYILGEIGCKHDWFFDCSEINKTAYITERGGAVKCEPN
jgi:hypothetical protein